VVSGLDYTGEKLADFLHITRPKYSYEIQAYMREQQQKAFDEREAKDNTWTIPPEPSPNDPITTPPKQSNDLRF
jgi:FAM177 family